MQRSGKYFCDEIWEAVELVAEVLEEDSERYRIAGDEFVNNLPEPIRTKIKDLVYGLFKDVRLFMLNTDWCEPLYVSTPSGLRYQFDRNKFIRFVSRELNDYISTIIEIAEDELDRIFYKHYYIEDDEDVVKRIAKSVFNLFVEIEEEELENLRKELGDRKYNEIIAKSREYVMTNYKELPKKYFNILFDYLGMEVRL